MSNRLAKADSLYLRQHGGNPVDWYPWGEEALNRAVSEGKLLFLSIGYSSCHWCHVMEHESFEDAATAAYLNEHFVCVKVDREERPDLDSLYMEAVQLMSGQGGWPLNVWLTPELKPVYGGTYFPPEPRHSRPSFLMVLRRLVELWTEDAAKLLDRAESIAGAIKEDLFVHLPPEPVTEETLRSVFDSNTVRFDATYGGFGSAPKFPMAMWLRFLWSYGAQAPESSARHMVLHSLLQMCRGGIYDAIGGGFHRYSTDERWLVPHFEKMLYDQALLLELMAEVWAQSRHPLLKACIDQTGDFLDREMRHPEGGYGSALDADNAGSEGGFYTWTFEELMRLAPEFEDIFDVTPQGNWEHRIILARTNDRILPPSTLERMRSERERRQERPAFDPKRLTSWNAMTLTAFCALHRHTEESIWRDRAVDLASTLRKGVFRGDLVLHQMGGTAGFCQDYATLAEAFCHMFELTNDAQWLIDAEQICLGMVNRFLDHTTASFYASEAAPDLLVRKKDLFDHAEPSGNSAALAAVLRLYRHTLNPTLLELVERGLSALAGIAADHGMSLGVALQVMVDSRQADALWMCEGIYCEVPVHTPSALADALRNHEK